MVQDNNNNNNNDNDNDNDDNNNNNNNNNEAVTTTTRMAKEEPRPPNAAATPCSDEAVRKKMVAMHFSYRGTQIVKSMPPDQLWLYAADTDSVNRAIGSSSAKVVYETSGSNLLRKNMQWNLPGLTLEFYEDPFQWDVTSHWWFVQRNVHKGPLQTMAFFVQVHPSSQNDSEVEMICAYQARSSNEIQEAVKLVEHAGLIMHKMWEMPLQMLSEGKPWKLATTSVNDQVKMDVYTRSLCDLGENRTVVDCLVSHITTRQESDLVDMQPLRLAAKWHVNEQDTISCFLRAARIGLLEPKWSLMCPMCRGSKGTANKAFDLADTAHCADCNLTVESNPRTSMQTVFSTSVRSLADQAGRACVGSATHTPHILAQATLEPGEHRCMLEKTDKLLSDDSTLNLCVRCPDLGVELNSQNGPFCGGEWTLDAQGFHPAADDETTSPSQQHFSLVNKTSHQVRVVMEDKDPLKYGSALSAEMVMNKPGFKTLFGAEEWDFLNAMIGKWRLEFLEQQQQEEVPSETLSLSEFDIAIIGSGPAGESLALSSAKLGKRVALIEQAKCFGGPTGLGSKAFREATLKVLSWTKLTECRPSAEVVQDIFNSRFVVFRDYAVTLVSHELMCRLGNAGVSLIRGRGHIDNKAEVTVKRLDDTELLVKAPVIALAVGSRPSRPANIPFDGIRVLDAQEICGISALPQSIAIIGGGIIAMEYASIFGLLGVQTHVINKYSSFLPMLDPTTCNDLVDIIEATGVFFHRGAQIVLWEGGKEEPVTPNLSTGTKLTVETVLYAQGREGPTENLVSTDIPLRWAKHGFLEADKNFGVGCPGIYAIGDVVGGGVASTAMDHGQHLAQSLFGSCDDACEHESSPFVLWTIPEVASVGMTKEKAEKENRSVIVSRASFREIPRGLLTGDLAGRLDMVVDSASGTIIGVHLLGAGASELVHYGANLISQGATVDQLSEKVFAAVTLHCLFNVAAERARSQLSKRKNPEL